MKDGEEICEKEGGNINKQEKRKKKNGEEVVFTENTLKRIT